MRILSLRSPFLLKSSLLMEQKHSHIVHAKTLEHFLLPLVLNRKSEASE